MIISNCPRCDEAIRVPADELPDDAYAQCPWCRETFPANDVLKAMPPILKVMSADGAPIVTAPRESATADMGTTELGVAALGGPGFGDAVVSADSPSTAETVVEDEMSSGLDLGDIEPVTSEIDEDDTWEPDESGALNESTSEVGTGTVTEETVTEETWSEEPADDAVNDGIVDFEIEDPDDTWEGEHVSSEAETPSPMKVSPAPVTRKKKKGGSGIMMAIKVVLGGVLAVPLAGGILTLFGQKPDWGFWPFDGGVESSSNVIAAPPANPSSDSATSALAEDSQSGTTLLPPSDFEFGDSTSGEAPAALATSQIMGDTLPDAEMALVPSDSAPAASAIELPNATAIEDPPTGAETAAKETADQPAPIADPDESDNDILAMPGETPGGASPIVGQPIANADDDSTTNDLAPPANQLRNPDPSSAEPEAEPATASASETMRSTDPSPAAAGAASSRLVTEATRAGKMVDFFARNTESDPTERTNKIMKTYKQIALTCDLAKGNEQALDDLAAKIRSSNILDDLGAMGPEWLFYRSRDTEGILLVGDLVQQGSTRTLAIDSDVVLNLVGDVQLPDSPKVLAMGRIIDDKSVELVLAKSLP